jgi:hypothetical protein
MKRIQNSINYRLAQRLVVWKFCSENFFQSLYELIFKQYSSVLSSLSQNLFSNASCGIFSTVLPTFEIKVSFAIDRKYHRFYATEDEYLLIPVILYKFYSRQWAVFVATSGDSPSFSALFFNLSVGVKRFFATYKFLAVSHEFSFIN